MNQNEIEKARALAVDSLIHWGKTGWCYYTMRNAVNNYLEAIGANRTSIDSEDGIKSHRRIAAKGLAIQCITPLTSGQLAKVDHELDEIADDIPRQSREIKI